MVTLIPGSNCLLTSPCCCAPCLNILAKTTLVQSQSVDNSNRSNTRNSSAQPTFTCIFPALTNPLLKYKKEKVMTKPIPDGFNSLSAHIIVSDGAVKAGCKVNMPVSDTFWGDRYGQVEDPFGHQWSIATHKHDWTPEQIAANAK